MSSPQSDPKRSSKRSPDEGRGSDPTKPTEPFLRAAIRGNVEYFRDLWVSFCRGIGRLKRGLMGFFDMLFPRAQDSEPGDRYVSFVVRDPQELVRESRFLNPGRLFLERERQRQERGRRPRKIRAFFAEIVPRAENYLDASGESEPKDLVRKDLVISGRRVSWAIFFVPIIVFFVWLAQIL